MSLIETFEELRANAQVLENVRVVTNHRDAVPYRLLIKQGMVFMPYVARDGLAFAPSRFIGYVENSIAKHNASENKDGKLTNARINRILREEFSLPISNAPDAHLEKYFLTFAGKLGITPHNVARSYWITPEISDWLEAHPVDGGANPTADLLVGEIQSDKTLAPTTKKAMIQARIGQGLFRRNVIKAYKRCLVTEVEQERLLVASHIKAWKDCYKDPAECLSPDNALLLTPTWDALFGKGFISFSDKGELMISDQVEKLTKAALGIPKSMKVNLTPGQRKFMKFHRNEFGFETN